MKDSIVIDLRKVREDRLPVLESILIECSHMSQGDGEILIDMADKVNEYLGKMREA